MIFEKNIRDSTWGIGNSKKHIERIKPVNAAPPLPLKEYSVFADVSTDAMNIMNDATPNTYNKRHTEHLALLSSQYGRGIWISKNAIFVDKKFKEPWALR